jgi:hypothetical protein
MATKKAPKKRTLSAAGRKRIAEAQQKRWQAAAHSPAEPQDTQETERGALQRIAGENTRLQGVIRSLQVCDEETKTDLADYAGILKRELAYHNLRVEEITRDLRHNGIEV